MKTKNKSKILYITIGCSGSGKSTWFDNQGFDPDRTAYVCMDDIRQEVCGNASDQSKNGVVFKIAFGRFKQALSLGIPAVFWDATSPKKKDRKQYINLAKKANYKVVAIYFDVPIEVAKLRNAKRERVVPPEVIDRQYARLQAPEKSEGFDEIKVVAE